MISFLPNYCKATYRGSSRSGSRSSEAARSATTKQKSRRCKMGSLRNREWHLLGSPPGQQLALRTQLEWWRKVAHGFPLSKSANHHDLTSTLGTPTQPRILGLPAHLDLWWQGLGINSFVDAGYCPASMDEEPIAGLLLRAHVYPQILQGNFVAVSCVSLCGCMFLCGSERMHEEREIHV